MDTKTYCENCGNEVTGPFCGNCGQRRGIGKITFKETFQDLVDMMFSVNAPLVKTQKLLVSNPGKLFREYLSGRRKAYYKPVSFFIITTIVYLIIRSLIQYDPMEGMAVVDAPKDFNQSLFKKAGQFMVTNINNIMFLFVLSMGLFFKAFFRKKNTLAEFIAICFYLAGVYTVIGTLSAFYLKYIDPRYKMIPMLIFMVYVIYALTSFFKSRGLFTIIKILIAYILSFIFYAAFGYMFSFLIVWLKSL